MHSVYPLFPNCLPTRGRVLHSTVCCLGGGLFSTGSPYSQVYTAFLGGKSGVHWHPHRHSLRSSAFMKSDGLWFYGMCKTNTSCWRISCGMHMWTCWCWLRAGSLVRRWWFILWRRCSIGNSNSGSVRRPDEIGLNLTDQGWELMAYLFFK